MNELNKLPNIGKVLATKLNEAGITTAEQLTHIGAENAFLKLSYDDLSACHTNSISK